MELNIKKLKRRLEDAHASLSDDEKARLRKEMEDDIKCKWMELERETIADEIHDKGECMECGKSWYFCTGHGQ